MARVSLRDKLFVLTTLSGVTYFATQLSSAPVDFYALSSAFPAVTPAFQEQQGFVSVLRWAESLHTVQDMDVFVRMVSQSSTNATMPPTVRNATGSSSSSRHRFKESLHVRLSQAASFEIYVHASKTVLQCGVLLFLYRVKTLPRQRAVRTICLCVLVLLCWKMAQSCLQDILSLRQRPLRATATVSAPAATRTTPGAFPAEMNAAFVSMLFLLRFAATALVNAVVGLAYQHYFCAPWPTSWRRVPRYVGSKDLVLSTLYYAASAVAAVSVSCATLRSLSEAALQLESAALACSLLHFVYFRVAHERPKQP